MVTPRADPHPIATSEARERFARRAAAAGLATPLVQLSGALIFLNNAAVCTAGMECLRGAVLGGLLVFVAAPTTLFALPLLEVIPSGHYAAAGVGLASSLPVWWVAGRRVGRRVFERTGRGAWGAFTVRWLLLSTAWTIVAFLLAIGLLRLLG